MPRRWLPLATWAAVQFMGIGAPVDLQPISSPGLPVASGSGGSFMPVLSLDGRYVVFVSQANNLVTNDDLRPYLDLFARDLVNQRTTLVSVNVTGIGGGDGNSNLPTVSSNGQWIAFESVASDVAEPDTNGVTDVFVRDMVAGKTMLASLSTNGVQAGNGPSSNPALTPDGRWLVFESAATDLVAGDTNGVPDVFVRDLQTGITTLVSVGLSNRSGMPSITPDGRFVAFVNTLSNAAPPPPALADIYVRDLQSSTTILASAGFTNFFPFGQAPVRALNPVLSANGRFVAYKASPRESSGYPARLLRFDLQTGLTVLVASNTVADSWPEMSADGRFIAYEDGTNVCVWDGETGSNALVSVNSSLTGGGNRPSHTPVMTPDGTKVVFLSVATNLVTDANNGMSQVFLRDLAQDTTRLVSANLAGGPSRGEIDVTRPAISADGRRIVFESTASDLVANDFNGASDVFVRDLQENRTDLVSPRDSSRAPSTGTGATLMTVHSVSADGRVIAFISRDNNLVPDDTNGLPDKLARDTFSGVTHLLRAPEPGADSRLLNPPELAVSAGGRYVAFTEWAGSSPSVWRYDLQTSTYARGSVSKMGAALPGAAPAISFDGRRIVFQSSAPTSEFVDGMTNGVGMTSVFLRDLEMGTNQLVSVNRVGTGSGNGPSTEPLCGPDGRRVLFASLATDLTTNVVDGGTIGGPPLRRLFMRDLASGTTVQVSGFPRTSPEWTYASGAVFSADSRYVAWGSSNGNVVVTDLHTGARVLVCTNCENPSISGNGRLVVYETRPNAITPFRQIIVQDLQTGASNLVSLGRFGTAQGRSTSPQISSDGRFIVFASQASDLVEDDTNGVSDIFVRDRLLGTTMLVSVNTLGRPGNAASSQPVMAADGRTIVFQSFANDLVAGDYNDRGDIFVLRLSAPDNDGDGLDDDWEMTYFDDLSRDGSSDFDRDGQTDREEFQAGTNPTNDTSLLRVLTLTALSDGTKTILWSAVPRRTYRVQYKNRVNAANWIDLPDHVTASSSTASAVDATARAQPTRFYRVVRLP